jgi:hypothetical protein
MATAADAAQARLFAAARTLDPLVVALLLVR